LKDQLDCPPNRAFFDVHVRTLLAGNLSSNQSKWLMTLDDNPQVRDLYMGFVRCKITAKLSAQKVAKGGRKVNLKQILVSNYQYNPEPLQ